VWTVHSIIRGVNSTLQIVAIEDNKNSCVFILENSLLPTYFCFLIFSGPKVSQSSAECQMSNVKCQIAVSEDSTRPPVDLRTLRGTDRETVTRLSPDRFSEAQTERIGAVKCFVLSIQ
jgi:hypothetical protein